MIDGIKESKTQLTHEIKMQKFQSNLFIYFSQHKSKFNGGVLIVQNIFCGNNTLLLNISCYMLKININKLFRISP